MPEQRRYLSSNDEEPERVSCWRSGVRFVYGFLEMSSIHGFNHLTVPRRHWCERLLWAVWIGVGIIGAAALSWQSLNRYYNDATVVAIERDFQNWLTPLPSAQICSGSKFDQIKVKNYVERFNEEKRNVTQDFIEELSLVDFRSLLEDRIDFDRLDSAKVDIPPDKYMEVLNNVSFRLAQAVINRNSSLWDLKYNLSVTERGICNAFNSDVAAYNWPQFFFLPRSVEYAPKGVSKLMQGTAIGGHLGLYAKDLNDRVSSIFTAPKDVPDISTRPMETNKGDFSFFEFTVTSTTSTPEVKDLTDRQRGCRFWNESNLEISPIYTYHWCRMNCRWRLAQKLCGCAPHFYKKIEGVKVCDSSGWKCLKPHAEYLINLRDEKTGRREDCRCVQMCEDNNYMIADVQNIQWYTGTSVEWSVKHFPRIRYRRELIFGFTDLLINIGGLAGLFLGCSVLSFTEIIYYFSMRLIIQTCKHFQK